MSTEDTPYSWTLFCPTPAANYVAFVYGFWYVARVWENNDRQMRLAPVFPHPELLKHASADPQVWESLRYSAMCAAINLTSGYDAREPEVVWEDQPPPLPEYLVGYDLLPERLGDFPKPAKPPTVGVIHTRPPWWAVLVPQAERTLERVQFFVPGDLDHVSGGVRDAAVRQAIRLLHDAR